MKNLIWLSFDLGIKGDYESFYSWLDQRKAKECGDNIACFWYEHSGDLLGKLKKDIKGSVSLDKKSRIYVIRLEKGKMKGAFVFGARKSAPWSGYAVTETQEEDVE